MTTTCNADNPLLQPTEQDVEERLESIHDLRYFLATAPQEWDVSEDEPPIKSHPLPSGESVSCVKWKHAFYITGTDIVRSLVYRFHAFGRPIQNLKKFEEGIFSDLRNLKPGHDAILEEPKSSFLDLLYKHNCIRTQKKQKVFHWYAVPHDRLFLDALERDLKREKMGADATSAAVADPAISFSLDTTQAMIDEFRKNLLSDLEMNACLMVRDSVSSGASSDEDNAVQPRPLSTSYSAPLLPTASAHPMARFDAGSPHHAKTTSMFGNFSLFEGSPSYKQRRRRTVGHHHSMYGYRAHHGLMHPHHPMMSSTHVAIGARHGLARPDAMDDPSRLYICPLTSCGKLFKRLEHLKRHLRTHTMERPYLCSLCGKRFSRSDNLAQHKKTHDRRQPPRSNSTSRDGHHDSGSNGNSNNNNDSNSNRNNSNSNSNSSSSNNSGHSNGGSNCTMPLPNSTHGRTSSSDPQYLKTEDSQGGYSGDQGYQASCLRQDNDTAVDDVTWRSTLQQMWQNKAPMARFPPHSGSACSSTVSSCYPSPAKSAFGPRDEHSNMVSPVDFVAPETSHSSSTIVSNKSAEEWAAGHSVPDHSMAWHQHQHHHQHGHLEQDSPTSILSPYHSPNLGWYSHPGLKPNHATAFDYMAYLQPTSHAEAYLTHTSPENMPLLDQPYNAYYATPSDY